MTLRATDDAGAATPLETLTPPVGSSSGFSIATLGLAIAVALFAGGFVGRTVSGRGRVVPRISVYDAIERRLGAGEASRP